MVKDLNDPTNRDSVHAILTPGEFVLNKEATAMYGPIIEKMNNHGLQQRQAENHAVRANMGQMVPQGYNRGGLVDFIKEEEGFRNKAYVDPVGIWTIGYGRTTNPDGSPIRPGQTTSRDSENSWIDNRVEQERAAVRAYGSENGYDWNEGQIDALASFRYNGGHGMLKKVTGNGQRDNATIGNKILQYNKGRVNGQLQELGGLTKRRQAESSMFTGGQGANSSPTRHPGTGPQAQPQQQQVPAQQATPPQQAPEVEEPSMKKQMLAGLKEGVAAGKMARANRPGPPAGHMTGRKFSAPEYIPSSAQRGPISSMRKRQHANMGGPIHLNEGGWLNSVLDWQGISGDGPTIGQKFGLQPGYWYDEDESEERKAALAGRPGIRPGQPMPEMSIPALQSPEMPVDAPLPGSDEAILQGSSDAQAQQAPASPFAGYADYSQQDFVNEATQPPVDPIDIPPEQYDVMIDEAMAYGDQGAAMELEAKKSAAEVAAMREAQGITKSLDENYESLPGQGVFEDPNVNRNVPPAPSSLDPNVGERPETGVEAHIWDVKHGETHDPETGKVDPDVADPRQADAGASGWKRDEKAAAEVTAALENIDNDPNTGDTSEGAINEAVGAAGGAGAIEQAGSQQPKEAVDNAKKTIKDHFKEWLNPGELARAALLFAGAAATGMSPGQALAFAGKDYLKRVEAIKSAPERQAKERMAKAEELIKSGKYTPGSLEAYGKSGRIADLELASKTAQGGVKMSGTFKEFNVGGKKVKGQQITLADGSKAYVDNKGQPIDQYNSRDWEKSMEPGTEEYRKRRDRANKAAEGRFSEIYEASDAVKNEAGKVVATNTKIPPKQAASEYWSWANEVGIDPESDESQLILTQAYKAAIADGKADNNLTPSKLRPYLEQQYIRETTGFPDLFKVGSGDKFINGNQMQALNSDVQAFVSIQNNQGSSLSTNQIYSSLAADWNDLPKDEQERYSKQVPKNSDVNGFYLFMKKKLQDKSLAAL